MEFVADGIRFNTISPGVVDTPMHANDHHEVLKKLHRRATIGSGLRNRRCFVLFAAKQPQNLGAKTAS